MQPITWYTMFLACPGTRRAAIIPTPTSQAKVLFGAPSGFTHFGVWVIQMVCLRKDLEIQVKEPQGAGLGSSAPGPGFRDLLAYSLRMRKEWREP